jgi:hypothetical protein
MLSPDFNGKPQVVVNLVWVMMISTGNNEQL